MLAERAGHPFAQDWLEAWNAHDLERILAHYAESVEFTSPLVARFFDVPDRALHGKAALRDYFGKALDAAPGLRFELLHVLEGVASVTLVYRSLPRDVLAAEVMELDAAGRVRRAMCHYAARSR
jgi:ketosteroid isomerase-like protein